MPSEKVRCEHEQLKNIQSMFSKQAESVGKLTKALQGKYEVLKGGGWIGQGAKEYIKEQDGMTFPELGRLQNALTSAAQATATISKTFENAEQEATSALAGGFL